MKRWIRWHEGDLILGLFILGVALLWAFHALARDNGQWTDQPAEIREWFRSIMQPGFEDMRDTGHSCCGVADAFDVELAGDNPDGSIEVKVINGKNIVPDGTMISVPHEKLQPKYGNPLDNYILFMGGGSVVYCLIPKSGM